MQILDTSGGGEKIVGSILTGDSTLDRPAVRRDLVLRERQFLTGSDAELPLHQVDPRHELRHWVLDLDARVHLEEVEVSALVEQELARAGVDVAGGAGHLDSALTHSLPQLRRNGNARRLLDHLLMAALHGALALAQRESVAV